MVAVVKSAFNSSLWYNRLGHMSVKRLKMLTIKEVLEDLKFVHTGLEDADYKRSFRRLKICSYGVTILVQLILVWISYGIYDIRNLPEYIS